MATMRPDDEVLIIIGDDPDCQNEAGADRASAEKNFSADGKTTTDSTGKSEPSREPEMKPDWEVFVPIGDSPAFIPDWMTETAENVAAEIYEPATPDDTHQEAASSGVSTGPERDITVDSKPERLSGTTDSGQDGDATDTPADSSVNHRKYSLPALSSQSRLMLATGLVFLVIVIGCCILVKSHANKVDPFDGVTLNEVVGYDGLGELPKYAADSKQMRSGYDDTGYQYVDVPLDGDVAEKELRITYVPDKTSKLSNGDKITVTVEYNQDDLDAVHVKLTETQKTFTVSGLAERYQPDGSDISEEDLSSARASIETLITEDLDYQDTSLKDLVRVYFVSKNDSDSIESDNCSGPIKIYKDALVAIYSYDEYYSITSEHETKYGYIIVEGINKNTNFSNLCSTSISGNWAKGQDGTNEFVSSVKIAENFIRSKYKHDKLNLLD